MGLGEQRRLAEGSFRSVSGQMIQEEMDTELAQSVEENGAKAGDHPLWKDRRALVGEWAATIERAKGSIGLERVATLAYPTAGTNNADLPETLYRFSGDPATPDETGVRRRGAPRP